MPMLMMTMVTIIYFVAGNGGDSADFDPLLGRHGGPRAEGVPVVTQRGLGAGRLSRVMMPENLNVGSAALCTAIVRNCARVKRLGH
jgi:hypothetical protein